ncbi:hypothetical protein EV426DRAFT_612094 [Tirmania nivea]|nr:hypothetical protein EV426DRAFT_612094 [Tirmania nivea]
MPPVHCLAIILQLFPSLNLPYAMFDIVARAQAVILRSLGEVITVIQQQTGITPRHIRNLHNEAQKRGWQPGTPLTLTPPLYT